MVKWGGWPKLIYGDAELLAEPVSQTIAEIAQHQKTDQCRRGNIKQDDWPTLVDSVGPFLNAFFQHQLNRLTDGPGSILTALHEVDRPETGQLMMAVILVATEMNLGVEVEFKSRYSQSERKDIIRLHAGPTPILTIEINAEHGEERLPLLLHCHGEDRVWDKEESTPGTPVWVSVEVDSKVAVFTDGLDLGDSTLQQATSDSFLKGQGFHPLRFSPQHLQHDLFACAAEAVKLVSGKTLPPPDE